MNIRLERKNIFLFYVRKIIALANFKYLGESRKNYDEGRRLLLVEFPVGVENKEVEWDISNYLSVNNIK